MRKDDECYFKITGCWVSFAIAFILFGVPMIVLLLIGGIDMSYPYSCPNDTVPLYRTNFCSFTNGTLINKEYNKNIYDKGGNKVLIGGILGIVLIIITIVICIMCCCDCECNCKRNKKLEKNENKKQEQKQNCEHNVDII